MPARSTSAPQPASKADSSAPIASRAVQGAPVGQLGNQALGHALRLRLERGVVKKIVLDLTTVPGAATYHLKDGDTERRAQRTLIDHCEINDGVYVAQVRAGPKGKLDWHLPPGVCREDLGYVVKTQGEPPGTLAAGSNVTVVVLSA